MTTHRSTGHRRRGTAATRRTILKSAASGIGLAALGAPALLIPGRARAASPLVVSLWGGSFTESFKAAFLEPFTHETGIETIAVGPPDLAKVRAMVRTKNVEWDIVLPLPIWQSGGEKEGLWEPVDYSIVDMSDTVPGAKRDYGIGFEIIAGGVCWSAARNGAQGKHPETWPEFWDVKRIPGRRGLRPREFETLELALLADGVPPAKMYPLDVDRAFRALDRIKPAVSNWIEATQQTISLVQQDECDFTYAYNGRVYAARQGGVDLGFSFKSNVNSMDWLAIVKGAPHKDAAQRLLAFVMRPERQADLVNRIAYAGTKIKAMDHVNDKVKQWLPELANPNSVYVDIDYWKDKQAELEKRFKEWLLT